MKVSVTQIKPEVFFRRLVFLIKGYILTIGNDAISSNDLFYFLDFHNLLNNFSELKRRMKAEQKAKEKAEKDAQKATTEDKEKKDAKKEDQLAEAEISPNEYFKLRSLAVAELKKNDATHPYPHKFHVSSSLEDFIEKYNHLNDGDMLKDQPLSLAGRIYAIREAGAKLIFYDVHGEGVKIQVMANCNYYQDKGEFDADTGKIRRGDIIGINGFPAKTKKGELSIVPRKVGIFRMGSRNRI